MQGVLIGIFDVNNFFRKYRTLEQLPPLRLDFLYLWRETYKSLLVGSNTIKGMNEIVAIINQGNSGMNIYN